MSESSPWSNSPVVVWTAVIALLLSVSSTGYAIYRAARGPDMRAFPAEDVILFGYPGEPDMPRELGVLAVFELANTSPDYPDILVSQTIRLSRDGQQIACLSARGEAKLASPNEPAPFAYEAAETIPLDLMTVRVLDESTRAELHAGVLLSRRQLFDQKASRSVVDMCHDTTPETHYTTANLVADFRGQNVDLTYEAQFSESPGLRVSCRVSLTDRRAELMQTRGWINAPCDAADVKTMPSDAGLLSAIGRFFDRIF